MKIAISLPDPLSKEAKTAAKDLGLSRSELIRTALKDFLERRRNAELIAEINRHIDKYGDPADGEEAWLEQARRTVSRTLLEEEASGIAKRKRKPRRQS
jgi:Arc/MetJ-type ribon-helix-helix transcriptional regulator